MYRSSAGTRLLRWPIELRIQVALPPVAAGGRPGRSGPQRKHSGRRKPLAARIDRENRFFVLARPVRGEDEFSRPLAGTMFAPSMLIDDARCDRSRFLRYHQAAILHASLQEEVAIMSHFMAIA